MMMTKQDEIIFGAFACAGKTDMVQTTFEYKMRRFMEDNMKEGVIYHKLKEKLPYTKIQRIENSLDIGTPDMFFCNKVHSGWIEAKQFKLPVRDTTPVQIPFRQGQYNWLRDLTDHGGLAILAMHTGDRRGYYYAVGKDIQEVYELSDFRRAHDNINIDVHPIRFIEHSHVQYFLE